MDNTENSNVNLKKTFAIDFYGKTAELKIFPRICIKQSTKINPALSVGMQCKYAPILMPMR